METSYLDSLIEWMLEKMNECTNEWTDYVGFSLGVRIWRHEMWKLPQSAHSVMKDQTVVGASATGQLSTSYRRRDCHRCSWGLLDLSALPICSHPQEWPRTRDRQELAGVLVPHSCHAVPWTGLLKTTEMDSLTILEDRNQKLGWPQDPAPDPACLAFGVAGNP